MNKRFVPVVFILIFAAVAFFTGCETTDTETKDCVVMLGDSIFALSGEEAEFLEELSGASYRTYYASGAQMEGGFVKTIPAQYEDALEDGDIRTVIFDGGGNDVLIGEPDACSTGSVPYGALGDACYEMMDKVIALDIAFWEQMIDDGVENLVNQGYYLTTDKDLWLVADIFTQKTIEAWNQVAAAHPEVNMIYVEVAPYFDENQAASYTIYDGIHPTTASSEKLANILWDAMVANNIEQEDTCDGFAMDRDEEEEECTGWFCGWF